MGQLAPSRIVDDGLAPPNAGFGSAAAYAKALGMSDAETKLKQAVSEIYKGDEYASKLAEAVEQAAA